MAGNHPWLPKAGPLILSLSKMRNYSVVQVICSIYPRYTLPETNGSPLKIDSWKRSFLLETIIFRGELLVLGRVYIQYMYIHTRKLTCNPTTLQV